MAGKPRTSHDDILGVVFTYAVVAALWILLSDKAAEWLFRDPAKLTLASTLKGWLFVAVTSLLLYGLVRRLVSRAEQSQAERLRALNLLAAVADSSDDAIFAKDRDGRYLLFNRAASKFVGVPAEDVLGRDDRAIFPAEQAESLMAIDRRVMAAGRVETNEEVLDTVEGRRTFLGTKGPLRDAHGAVLGIFGISRDITGRKQAEEALRGREETLSAIISYSPSALSLKRPDGHYALANPNLQRSHHLTEAEIIGKTDFDLYPEEAARAFRANDELVLRTGTRHSVEEVVPVGGQPRVCMSHMFPVLAKDGTVRYICRISLDITERKRADAALQARNAELERFNRAVVGRELDMIELKRQVNELSRQLGRAAPFSLSSLDAPGLGEPAGGGRP